MVSDRPRARRCGEPAEVRIGADGLARLTDFGIAQPLGATRITLTGHGTRTQRYIAPEVLNGHAENERSHSTHVMSCR